MKNRLLLPITLLSLMAITFACGGAPTANNSNANANKANTMSNTASNTMSNTMSNTALNTMSNTAANTAANKPANMAANKMTPPANTAANKPARAPKGSTAECNDGTFSDSKTASGQCSGHGGVKRKIG